LVFCSRNGVDGRDKSGHDKVDIRRRVEHAQNWRYVARR
jgi:hypothetical protein